MLCCLAGYEDYVSHGEGAQQYEGRYEQRYGRLFGVGFQAVECWNNHPTYNREDPEQGVASFRGEQFPLGLDEQGESYKLESEYSAGQSLQPGNG